MEGRIAIRDGREIFKFFEAIFKFFEAIYKFFSPVFFSFFLNILEIAENASLKYIWPQKIVCSYLCLFYSFFYCFKLF